jgi:hypothetical protein
VKWKKFLEYKNESPGSEGKRKSSSFFSFKALCQEIIILEYFWARSPT